jgi:hypothetical protein
MARRYDDEGELPWPKHLAEFDPAKWRDRQEWHKARAEVARSLGRPVLPEVSSAAPSSRCTMVREDWAWLLLLALQAGAETGRVRRGRSRLPQWCR